MIDMSNQTITSLVDDSRPTRDRLLDAGMALIAERGFNGVSVGEIEAAVGLVPRRGALYKHFPSKQAMIEAGMEERIAGVADLSSQVEWLSSAEALADPRAAMRAVGEVALTELSREKHINQIIEKDGGRFPQLRDRMRAEMVEPGFHYAEQLLEAWIQEVHGSGSEIAKRIDVAGLAAVLLGALVHHRRQEWLLGAPPHNIETERFLDAWVDTALRTLNINDEEKR